MNKNIIIGSDHAGYSLKTKIIEYLCEIGYEPKDMGTNNELSCDYPLIAQKSCTEVIKTNGLGILICGTGVGMSIAANKLKGIRAAVVSESLSAKYSKLHNNTNVLCIGARIIGEETAKDIIKTWLDTSFEGERHQARVNMLE